MVVIWPFAWNYLLRTHPYHLLPTSLFPYLNTVAQEGRGGEGGEGTGGEGRGERGREGRGGEGEERGREERQVEERGRKRGDGN